MFRTRRVLLILVCLLVACAPATQSIQSIITPTQSIWTPTATSTSSPTETPSPTGTPSPTITASPTGTSSPTITAFPIGTPSLTETATPTRTPSPTKSPSPTSTPYPTFAFDPIVEAYHAPSDWAVGFNHIACWGDSLTSGAGGTPYPTTLAALSGYSVYNGGKGAESSTEIKARMLAATDKYSWPTVIWAGRNNVDDPTTVKADIAEMVAVLGHNNFLVLGILNGESAIEEPGGERYKTIVQLNSDLAAIYGKHFIDVREYLVHEYDPTSPEDVIDFQNDTVPASLRSNYLHLNSRGYMAVARLLIPLQGTNAQSIGIK